MGQGQSDWHQLENCQRYGGVAEQGHRRHQAGRPVVGDDENQHQAQAHQAGHQAAFQRGGAQQRIDFRFLDEFQRHGQLAGFQLHGQGARRFPVEIAGYLTAPVADMHLRHRRNQLLAVQEYGDDFVGLRVATDVDGAGHIAKNFGAAVVELDVDDPFAGSGVGAVIGVVQVVAGEADALVVVGGDAAAGGLHRGAALPAQEFQLRRLANQPLGVLNAAGGLERLHGADFVVEQRFQGAPLADVQGFVGGDADGIAVAGAGDVKAGVALAGGYGLQGFGADVGVVGKLRGNHRPAGAGQLHDDAVVAEPLHDGFLGAVQVDAAADDAEHAVHLLDSRRGNIVVDETGRLADGLGEGGQHFGPAFRRQIGAGDGESGPVVDAGVNDVVRRIVGVGQGRLHPVGVGGDLLGELHIEGGAGFGLIDEMGAALQVQAEFQPQGAGFGPVQAPQAGDADMDFRQRQRGRRDAQHDYDKGGQ